MGTVVSLPFHVNLPHLSWILIFIVKMSREDNSVYIITEKTTHTTHHTSLTSNINICLEGMFQSYMEILKCKSKCFLHSCIHWWNFLILAIFFLVDVFFRLNPSLSWKCLKISFLWQTYVWVWRDWRLWAHYSTIKKTNWGLVW